MMKTKYITTIHESEPFVFENHIIYIWDKFSAITNEKVRVTDPIYAQNYLFNIWLLEVGMKQIKFGIGEFSNSVYGVFLVE